MSASAEIRIPPSDDALATRIIDIAHGMNTAVANRLWTVGVVVSGLVSVAIMTGLCGARI
jgi:hypothetical protein